MPDPTPRLPSSIPDKVWPPRASDHDNRRLALNMIASTIFGFAVKATQIGILMETKLVHYTPEMKAITKKRWIGESRVHGRTQRFPLLLALLPTGERPDLY